MRISLHISGLVCSIYCYPSVWKTTDVEIIINKKVFCFAIKPIKFKQARLAGGSQKISLAILIVSNTSCKQIPHYHGYLHILYFCTESHTAVNYKPVTTHLHIYMVNIVPTVWTDTSYQRQ